MTAKIIRREIRSLGGCCDCAEETLPGDLQCLYVNRYIEPDYLAFPQYFTDKTPCALCPDPYAMCPNIYGTFPYVLDALPHTPGNPTAEFSQDFSCGDIGDTKITLYSAIWAGGEINLCRDVGAPGFYFRIKVYVSFGGVSGGNFYSSWMWFPSGTRDPSNQQTVAVYPSDDVSNGGACNGDWGPLTVGFHYR